MIVNVISGLFKGDSEFQKATREIDRAIAAFTAAIVDLGSVCGIELVKQTSKIQDSICDLSLRFEEFVVNFENHLRISDDMKHDAKTVVRQVETGNTLSHTEYYGVPFDRNSEFVGRKSILASLFDQLNDTTNSTKRVALFGLGGIGKTQIALEYLHCNSERYRKIYWVAASDRSCIETGLANIVRQSGVPLKQELPVSEVAGQMVNWLSRNSAWLLILDGLDDITAIRGMLPGPPYHGHVIITTRNTHVADITAVGLEVTEMEETEAERLFLDISELLKSDELKSDEPKVLKEVHNIVQELGCLPLAINQAASFVRSSPLYSFLTAFRSSRLQFLSDEPQGSHPYPRSISATWHMSIEKLPPRAQQLAEILAFLNGDEIQVSFLLSHIGSFEGNIREILADGFLFVKSLTALQGYSLVKIANHGKIVVMHRLLQAVIRDHLAANHCTNLQCQLLNLCEHTFQYSAFTDNDLEVRNFHRSVCPQILGTLHNFDPDKYKDFLLRKLSDSLLDFLFDEAQYSQCKEVGERMLEERRQSFGADDTRLLATQRGLAAVYSAAQDETFCVGNVEESKAVDLFKETLRQQTQVLGSEHPDTLWTKHGLAVAYSRAKKDQEALNLILETYDARSRILGPLHMHTLRSKHFVAIAYDVLGRHDDARRLVEETVKNREETLGKDHLETLRSILTLANILRRTGETITARTLYQRVVTGRAAMLGVDHPHTVWARRDMLAFEQEEKEKDERLRASPATETTQGHQAEKQFGQGFATRPWVHHTSCWNSGYQSYGGTAPWPGISYGYSAQSFGGTPPWAPSTHQGQSYRGTRSWQPPESSVHPAFNPTLPTRQSFGGTGSWPPPAYTPQQQSYGGTRLWESPPESSFPPAFDPTASNWLNPCFGGTRPWTSTNPAQQSYGRTSWPPPDSSLPSAYPNDHVYRNSGVQQQSSGRTSPSQDHERPTKKRRKQGD